MIGCPAVVVMRIWGHSQQVQVYQDGAISWHSKRLGLRFQMATAAVLDGDPTCHQPPARSPPVPEATISVTESCSGGRWGVMEKERGAGLLHQSAAPAAPSLPRPPTFLCSGSRKGGTNLWYVY